MKLVLAPGDVAAIERATVEAVAPDRVVQLPGWLLPMDPGTIGRARSAVPLVHAQGTEQQAQVRQLPAIVAKYRAEGYAPAFRLPASAQALHEALGAMGFQGVEPSLVMAGPVDDLACVVPESVQAGAGGVDVSTVPSDGWKALFLGEGMDPVDGTARVRNLSRAPHTLYVSWQEGGDTLACGAASFGQGWLGVHGMRTALAQRGRGLAGQVLRAMALQARLRGIDRVFLQVGGANSAAQSLYRRAGLGVAWDYAYWKPLA